MGDRHEEHHDVDGNLSNSAALHPQNDSFGVVWEGFVDVFLIFKTEVDKKQRLPSLYTALNGEENAAYPEQVITRVLMATTAQAANHHDM